MQNTLYFLQKAAISLFFLTLYHSLTAQHNFSLEKVEGEGLTNYYIKCISQDKNGYLWFGTEEGLFRYDGYTFLPVRNFLVGADSLPNSNIECLLPGDSGRIWVGSRGGLSCIEGKTMVIRNFPASTTFRVYSLLPLGDTAFIAGTSAGLYNFSKQHHG